MEEQKNQSKIMKKMVAYALMIAGGVIFTVGLILFLKPSPPVEHSNSSSDEIDGIVEMAVADGVLTKNEKDVIKRVATEKGVSPEDTIKHAEHKISTMNTDAAETEIIDVNKRNGDDFEKFVVQKFNKKFFKIKEWAGDKYVKGRYAETTQQPDLQVEFAMGKSTAEFCVECKWRSKFFQGGIEFASEEQLKRYKKFEETRGIPVFIAIGVGGTGKAPQHLYIVPLRTIDSNVLPFEVLKGFRKKTSEKFYFDPSTNELK